MLTQGTGFASYSKTLCWIVSVILLALAALSFTGGGDNGMMLGFLWLAGGVAFALSAYFLSRSARSSGESGGGD